MKNVSHEYTNSTSQCPQLRVIYSTISVHNSEDTRYNKWQDKKF